jgi:hypothetical protein
VVAAFFNFALPGLMTGSGQWLFMKAWGGYIFVTFSACGPLGPCVTSNSTS